MNERAPSWIPALLFGLTFGRHHCVDWLAQFFADPACARRALFYVAGGIVACALYALIIRLTPWRPHSVRIGVALVCWWGMLEEAQTVICRVGLGLGAPAPIDHPWRNVCDQLAGIPISTITLAIPACIICWLANNTRGQEWRNRLQPP